MAIPPKEGKLIYHLTALDNLEAILTKGLLPRNGLTDFVDVADESIINHRQTIGLDNYVPFHFFAGTPFDGAVQKGNPMKKFIFITIQRTFAELSSFGILTRHPLSQNCSTVLPYPHGFASIDWDKMAKRDYSENDCKEICMAECLSPVAVKPKDFFLILVPDNETYNSVCLLRDKILRSDRPFVQVNTSIFVK